MPDIVCTGWRTELAEAQRRARVAKRNRLATLARVRASCDARRLKRSFARMVGLDLAGCLWFEVHRRGRVRYPPRSDWSAWHAELRQD